MESDDNRLQTGGGFEAYLDIGKQDSAVDRLLGQERGDYRIVGLIAEGGMGRVYRAERTDARFEWEVAIKGRSALFRHGARAQKAGLPPTRGASPSESP